MTGEIGHVPEHECEKVAEATLCMDGRYLWVGKLVKPVSRYPHEQFCLHLETPEKPPTVFLMNEADWHFLVVMAEALGVKPKNESWVVRMAEGFKRAAKRS